MNDPQENTLAAPVPAADAVSRDVVIRLLEQMIAEIKSHRHEFRGFLNNHSMQATNDSTAHKQIDDMHTTMKFAQGAFQNFASIPKDLSEMKNVLITRATENRSGMQPMMVMLIFILFAVLNGIPQWLGLINGNNMKLNVTRDGVGIESQEGK